MGDTSLRDAVQTELAWEPRVDAAHIGVTAKAGVVTLTGHVPSFAAKLAAETAARRVKGVKAVAEELDVRLPFSVKRDDGDIAAAIVDRLAWDAQGPHDHVTATVDHGRVTLTGQVDWQFQREAAEDHVRYLSGVTSLSNQLTLKSRVDTQTIRDDIDHALGRSWFFDPETIHVAADGGKVTLTGTARTPYDRALAASTAWAAPGATSVENEILVV